MNHCAKNWMQMVSREVVQKLLGVTDRAVVLHYQIQRGRPNPLRTEVNEAL